MLLHAHSYLKPSGRLYLVLPRACVSNSRYLTHERLTAILGSCGWDVERQDDSKRLTRWLCTRKERVLKSLKKGKEWDGKVWKKEEVHQGKALNVSWRGRETSCEALLRWHSRPGMSYAREAHSLTHHIASLASCLSAAAHALLELRHPRRRHLELRAAAGSWQMGRSG